MASQPWTHWHILVDGCTHTRKACDCKMGSSKGNKNNLLMTSKTLIGAVELWAKPLSLAMSIKWCKHNGH
jgi:hypothetical protein